MAQIGKKKKRNLLQALIPVALVLLIVLVVVLSVGNGDRKNAEAMAIQEGLDFLSQQEQKKPEPIRQARQALYKRRMEEQKEELLEDMENGEIDPFSLFQDYAILGDSRTEGFSFWGFLPEDRILAVGGYKIFHIPEWHEKLLEMQPQYLFLCYGLNDSYSEGWASGEDHAADYMEYVRELKQLLPNTTIVVSSILPVDDVAFDYYSGWRDLPDWNVALKAACEKEGVLFADCDSLYEEHSEQWDVDGIHFLPTMYPLWAGKLIVTALYGGMTNET